jgi:hypothetical protein
VSSSANLQEILFLIEHERMAMMLSRSVRPLKCAARRRGTLGLGRDGKSP